MRIDKSVNFAGFLFCVYDEVNSDRCHFRVQTDNNGVVTDVRNVHTDHWACVDPAVDPADASVIVYDRGNKVFPSSDITGLSVEQLRHVSADHLDKASRTAVAIVSNAYPDVHFA